MKRFIHLLALLLLFTPARAQDEAVTEGERLFFRTFKKATLSGDRAWITSHICLPVRAMIDGSSRLLTTTQEVTEHYGAIMTFDVVNAIRRQTADALVKTRQGIMIGDGEVWFGENPAAETGTNASGRFCILAFGNDG